MNEETTNVVLEGEVVTSDAVAGDAVLTIPEDDLNMVIKFKKPYLFEKKEYTEIDLSAIENVTGEDMIAIDKLMQKSAVGISVMPEVSMEYAFYMAARVTKLPVEFFMNLPTKEAMKVKTRVLGFLFGSE